MQPAARVLLLGVDHANGLRHGTEYSLHEALRTGRLTRDAGLPPYRALDRELGIARGTLRRLLAARQRDCRAAWRSCLGQLTAPRRLLPPCPPSQHPLLVADPCEGHGRAHGRGTGRVFGGIDVLVAAAGLGLDTEVAIVESATGRPSARVRVPRLAYLDSPFRVANGCRLGAPTSLGRSLRSCATIAARAGIGRSPSAVGALGRPGGAATSAIGWGWMDQPAVCGGRPDGRPPGSVPCA
jgi:hypothetical protein